LSVTHYRVRAIALWDILSEVVWLFVLPKITERNREMNILVTGGTVFASRYVTEYFCSKGHKVYTLNRGNYPQPDGAELIKCDRHALGDALKNYSFDAVLDVTAYDCNDVKDLLEALGGFGTYIFVSSSAVYPETLPQPFNEQQECGANAIWGDYGVKKLAAEKFISENIRNYYIIRPPYLYGPMNNVYREAFVFECAEKGLPFYVPKDGKMGLQFLHIRDMCRFMEILLEKQPHERVYNVGNAEIVNIEQWVKLCYQVLGKTPELRYVSADVPQRNYFPFYDYDYVLDVARQDELMQEKIPLYEGLCEAYEWYRGNKSAVKRKPLLEFISKSLS